MTTQGTAGARPTPSGRGGRPARPAPQTKMASLPWRHFGATYPTLPCPYPALPFCTPSCNPHLCFCTPARTLGYHFPPRPTPRTKLHPCGRHNVGHVAVLRQRQGRQIQASQPRQGQEEQAPLAQEVPLAIAVALTFAFAPQTQEVAQASVALTLTQALSLAFGVGVAHTETKEKIDYAEGHRLPDHPHRGGPEGQSPSQILLAARVSVGARPRPWAGGGTAIPGSRVATNVPHPLFAQCRSLKTGHALQFYDGGKPVRNSFSEWLALKYPAYQTTCKLEELWWSTDLDLPVISAKCESSTNARTVRSPFHFLFQLCFHWRSGNCSRTSTLGSPRSGRTSGS